MSGQRLTNGAPALDVSVEEEHMEDLVGLPPVALASMKSFNRSGACRKRVAWRAEEETGPLAARPFEQQSRAWPLPRSCGMASNNWTVVGSCFAWGPQSTDPFPFPSSPACCCAFSFPLPPLSCRSCPTPHRFRPQRFPVQEQPDLQAVLSAAVHDVAQGDGADAQR